MMLQNPKPRLYLPTMALVVPCDYKPKTDCEFVRVLTARWNLEVSERVIRHVQWAAREVSREN